MKKYLLPFIVFSFFLGACCSSKEVIPSPKEAVLSPKEGSPVVVSKPTGRVLDKPPHFVMPNEIRSRFKGFMNGRSDALVVLFPDETYEIKRINFIHLRDGKGETIFYYDHGFSEPPIDEILEKWLISEFKKVKVLIPPSERVELIWPFRII